MLVDPVAIHAEPVQNAAVRGHPDLIRERSDRLYVRDRDPLTTVTREIDERDRVAFGNHERTTVAREL
jgi:hypothetical protein